MGFWLTTVPGSELMDMAVVPGEDKQIIANFKLNNPTSEVTTVDYTFYANEELMLSGASTIAPYSSKKYLYPLQIDCNALKIYYSPELSPSQTYYPVIHR